MDVEKNDVGRLALYQVESLAAIRGASCLIAMFSERAREQLADHRIVVDHEHSNARPPERWHHERGHACKKRNGTGWTTASLQIVISPDRMVDSGRSPTTSSPPQQTLR